MSSKVGKMSEKLDSPTMMYVALGTTIGFLLAIAAYALVGI